jgi:uncharacterized membrane protein
MAEKAGGDSSRRLRWMLIASLAVNLLVIGAVAGSMFAWHRHGGWGPGRGGEFGLLGFSRTLPDQSRKMLRDAVMAKRAEFKQLRQDARKARSEAAEILVSEPYDKEKLRETFVRIKDAEDKLKAVGLTIFLDAGEKLTMEERRSLRSWWERRWPPRSSYFDKGDKDDGTVKPTP